MQEVANRKFHQVEWDPMVSQLNKGRNPILEEEPALCFRVQLEEKHLTWKKMFAAPTTRASTWWLWNLNVLRRTNQSDNFFQGAVQTQVWPRDTEHLCQALWSRSVLFREDKIRLHRALSLKQVPFTFSIPLLSSKICLLLSLSQLCNIPQRGYFYFHFHIVHFLSKRWVSSHSHFPGNMCTPSSAWRNSKVTRSGNSR